jgi:hypothetical protein
MPPLVLLPKNIVYIVGGYCIVDQKPLDNQLGICVIKIYSTRLLRVTIVLSSTYRPILPEEY